MHDASSASGGFAEIRHRALRLRLVPGQALTAGRGQDCDLRIGNDPVDRYVPRRAVRIECREEGLLVHNLSEKATLTLIAVPGPSTQILPLSVAGTRPHRQLWIELPGRSTPHRVAVDTSELRGSAPSPADPVTDPEVTEGYFRIESLSEQHRVLLCALCLPSLTQAGAQVPTYGQIAEILAQHGYVIRTKTVRNRLDELRARLTDEFDVRGLQRGEGAAPRDAAHESYLPALERWARHSGNATLGDVERLMPRGHRG